jgi:cytochrome P450
MAYTKESVMEWVNALKLNSWGPTEVNWNDDIHRVHVIVGEGESAKARKEIEAAVAKEIENKTTDPIEAQDFLEHLYVTDYAQED